MSSTINCLIVDDEPIAREIIQGYSVHLPVIKIVASCANALEAKTVMEKQAIDVIFLDINMPGMNGWEFLDEFNNLTHHVKTRCKIFMLTSSIDPSDIKKSQTYSTVKDFITKPLTKEKLEKLSL